MGGVCRGGEGSGGSSTLVNMKKIIFSLTGVIIRLPRLPPPPRPCPCLRPCLVLMILYCEYNSIYHFHSLDNCHIVQDYSLMLTPMYLMVIHVLFFLFHIELFPSINEHKLQIILRRIFFYDTYLDSRSGGQYSYQLTINPLLTIALANLILM